MKKRYINPDIQIVKIASQIQMLAGSADPQFSPGEESSTMDSHGDENFDW